jgi:hypothetical protein
VVEAPAERLFDALDDHARMSAHMNARSWMLGGGRMETTTDEGDGRRVGSHIRLAGRVFGVRLHVDEVVTEHDRPRRKTWQTVGEPRLLVIGPYRMGFDIEPDGPRSVLRVFIDYDLPSRGFARWIARVLGNWYARWCTRRMTEDAARRFSPDVSG